MIINWGKYRPVVPEDGFKVWVFPTGKPDKTEMWENTNAQFLSVKKSTHFKHKLGTRGEMGYIYIFFKKRQNEETTYTQNKKFSLRAKLQDSSYSKNKLYCWPNMPDYNAY